MKLVKSPHDTGMGTVVFGKWSTFLWHKIMTSAATIVVTTVV